MFDEGELEEVLELHARTYRLVLWIGGAIERGFIPFDRAHEYATTVESAEAWLDHHYLNLPVDARPAVRSGPGLSRYASFLVSYLQVSFELDAYAGSRLVSRNGCYCSFCASLEAASHLKTKKLGRKDKEAAQKVKRKYLTALAREQDRDLDDTEIERLLGNAELGHDAALAAYVDELLNRCRGVKSSPAVLALWREIAWTKQGSPKPKFRLRTQDIIKAEQHLLTAVVKSPD
jgi:hypothetical protein